MKASSDLSSEKWKTWEMLEVLLTSGSLVCSEILMSWGELNELAFWGQLVTQTNFQIEILLQISALIFNSKFPKFHWTSAAVG